MKITFAQVALVTLNALSDGEYNETDWWSNRVAPLVGYDDDLTGKLDRGGMSDHVGFEDGSYARYEPSRHEWQAESESDYVKFDGRWRSFEEMTETMNDEVREQVHMELAPCAKQEFIDRYCELHADFEA